MRIATSQFYSANVQSMDNQQAQLAQLNQEISSGTTINTPADNPLGAAQAVQLTMTTATLTQYTTNQSSALTSLQLEDNTLTSVTNVMQSMSTLIVQAGDESLNDGDRGAIARELQSFRSQLLTLSNTTDGAGNYIFSGFQSKTQPFTDVPGVGVQYSGDTGQRLVQVAGNRQISTSDSGVGVFQSVPSLGTQPVPGGPAAGSPPNTGTGTIGPVTITDPSQPSNNDSYSIVFGTDPVTSAPTYTVSETTAGAPPTTTTMPAVTYTPGSDIQIKLGAGMTTTISGTPNSGDSFNVTPATTQANANVFNTLDSVIAALQAPVSSTQAGFANLSNTLSQAATAFHNSMTNVTMIQASVGGREQELQALQTSTSSNTLQAQSNLANITDVDMVSTISQFEQVQNALSAAQKSFVQVQNLSLFQYITN
jgi:flagellar hook-associated protein 3 FlgL